ncbi:hypothetical protein JCM18899A_23510 [Nocardioides sp. AN3]
MGWRNGGGTADVDGAESPTTAAVDGAAVGFPVGVSAGEPAEPAAGPPPLSHEVRARESTAVTSMATARAPVVDRANRRIVLPSQARSERV